MEQKKVTQGLVMVLSDEGGRYMASEKQVSNNLSISVLKREKSRPAWSHMTVHMTLGTTAHGCRTHLFRSWM